MPGSNSILPRVNLATASFTPATFQGNTFTPQQAASWPGHEPG